MYINNTKREIVLTKAEYTKAMRIGTPEFEDLFRAKQILPSGKIVIKKSTNKNAYKKITKAFILNYAKSTNKEYYENLLSLFNSIGETVYIEETDEYKEVSFFYIRNEFLKKNPQFMTVSDREKFEKAKTENFEISEEPEEMVS